MLGPLSSVNQLRKAIRPFQKRENMAKRKNTPQRLLELETLEKAIDTLPELDEYQKDFLKTRWVHQVSWWDKRAWESRKKYYTFRSIAAVGSVVVPALVGLNLGELAAAYIRWITFFLGLLVAASLALDELFHFGDIWREKRDAAEVLKCEGWRFIQLSGKYKGRSYKEAYPEFAEQVEEIIEREIKTYIGVVQERPKISDKGKSLT
jgi:hypothetical protein